MSDTPSHVHPGIRAALMVLLNHVEPGWENCKEVVQMWLDGKFEQPQERAAGIEARPHADDERTVSQSPIISDTPLVERLRFQKRYTRGVVPVTMDEAADRIEQLERDVNALMDDIRKGDDMLMAWFKAASPWATPGSLEEGLKQMRSMLERLAAPIGWDMAMCQEQWGTEGDAKYEARMMLFRLAP